MLGRIAKAAKLTAGQIAVKSGISRSQAYALVKEVSALPSRPEQVRAFLQACTVAPSQVDEVMELWQRLSETHVKIPDLEPPREVDTNALQQFALMAQANPIHPRDLAAYSVGGDLHVQTIHRSTASELTDLVRHVIDDERRTNRALRLVGRLATVLFAVTLARRRRSRRLGG